METPMGTLTVKINEAPGEAAKSRGHAVYPDDFPHLTPGEDFCFWVDWDTDTLHVETTLPSDEIQARLQELQKILNPAPV